MNDTKIVSSIELLEGLSSRMRELENPEGVNINAIKTYQAGVGRVVSLMRMETDAYDRMGLKYRPHVLKFLGVEGNT